MNPSLATDLDRLESPTKMQELIGTIPYLGYEILFGRNAFSNENLVMGHAHRDCIWCHAIYSKGTHVVLCIKGKDYPMEEVLRRAAGIALEYSKALVREVSYAPLKDVFKPEGAKVGVFRTWRTEKIVL